MKKLIIVAGICLLAAGCQTTQQATQALQGKWIGQPVDDFFVQNGPPQSSFALASGGQIYTWRGGELSYVQPAQVQTRPVGPAPAPAVARTVTQTTTSNPSPGVTVTRSQTSSSSFGVSVPQTVTTTITPARRIELFCEAQIAVDDKGLITSVRISRDTSGEFLSLSRCADIFVD